ncbi:MAG: proton-conducting transporter membrane subunit [Bacteroidota bacterium]
MFSAVLSVSLISSYYAVNVLNGNTFEYILQGSSVTGPIPVRGDALSGWFVLIINFVFVTGSFYGTYYLRQYRTLQNNISLHAIAFVIMHSAMVSLCFIQNSLVFLIIWEIMAMSAFLTIIMEYQKITVIKAGINYLIQAHVSLVFLMMGFIYVAFKTGSYDFNAITAFTAGNVGAQGLVLFFLFFIAFAIKAGFVPFHTWLPYAHPAAPSHVSGIMSGVIIKIGIFGILRMLLLIRLDFITIGYFIMIVSLISGLYGVMLAIVQHDLKKLLAYHSVENIGIIGLGIGLGCLGLGYDNAVLTSIGFAGALLHTLNHALFKSLLFFTAGNVYQQTHTLNIEKLGGLIKKMPQTAALFLIAAIAICGIPPFNGFVSEFIIYNGFYVMLHNSVLASLIAIIFAIMGLVMIGGLAIFCFTKAFGVVFLGNPRHELKDEIKEVPFIQLIPLYLIAFVIVLIGTFPTWFIHRLISPVTLFTGLLHGNFIPFEGNALAALQPVSWAAWLLILLSGLVFAIRKLVMSKSMTRHDASWGCAYIAPTARQQYTGGSFVRSYSKLFKMVLLAIKKEKDIEGIFPEAVHYETHPYDKVEYWLIDKPLRAYHSLMSRFLFLQNGRLQFYILYGIIFIGAVICIPLLYQGMITFIDFLKQL